MIGIMTSARPSRNSEVGVTIRNVPNESMSLGCFTLTSDRSLDKYYSTLEGRRITLGEAAPVYLPVYLGVFPRVPAEMPLSQRQVVGVMNQSMQLIQWKKVKSTKFAGFSLSNCHDIAFYVKTVPFCFLTIKIF